MGENTPVEKKKFDARDWPRLCEFVRDEHATRKSRRRDMEAQWDIVDDQLARKAPAMVTQSGGRPEDEGWFRGLPLSLQNQSLEVLTSDCDRLRFPEGRNFFSAHAEMEDAVLESLDYQGIIAGDTNDVPSKVDQENLDAIVEAVLGHNHSLYDFREQWTRLDAEALKYGTFVGRIAMIRPDKMRDGLTRKPVPMLIPGSVRNTFLDDNTQHVMNEGIALAPSTIREYWQNLDDLRIAAAKGSTDPDSFTGGWMPKAIDDLAPGGPDEKSVQLLEYEGDVVIPRSRGPNVYLENCILTVCVGKGQDPARPVRLRYNKYPFRPTISQPYHVEGAFSPYGVSPLMMGSSLATAAAEAKNSLMQSAILNADPPVWVSPVDYFAKAITYSIHPHAILEGLTAPVPLQIGDPVALMQVLTMLLQFYADVVGVNAPRLGAQTKSHQTAFAVDSEMSRGVVRTVDYVRSSNRGAMTRFLMMEYAMLRDTMGETDVFSEKYGSYLKIGRKQLPETITLDVHGAGGPLEEREREVKQQAGLSLALQIEAAMRQMGERGMDLLEAQKHALRTAGFNDIDGFYPGADQAAPAGIAGGPAVPGGPALAGDPIQQAIASLAAG